MLNERFWSKVDKNAANGCWVWLSCKNNKGYGTFSINSYVGKKLAHRLSYEDAHGPIPKGGLILHSCDNPSCVSPDHLRVGNHKQNIADMDHRGRRVSNAPRGTNNPISKLTDQQVIDLRIDYINGIPKKEIAKKYGVKASSLNDYTSGKSWKHLFGKDGAPTLAELKAAKRTKLIDRKLAHKVWAMHMSHNSVSEIAEQLNVPKNTVAGLVSGKRGRYIKDAPSLEELKKGGVRRGFNQFSRDQS